MHYYLIYEPLACHSFCLFFCLYVIHYICPSLLLSCQMSILSSSDCSSVMLSICPFVYPFIYLSARPFICYAVCLFASLPPYLNSYKPFLTLSDQYWNPEQGFKTGSSSESLLKFDTRSKPLGHHSRFMFVFIYVSCTWSSFCWQECSSALYLCLLQFTLSIYS